jgi:hypothetical protein
MSWQLGKRGAFVIALLAVLAAAGWAQASNPVPVDAASHRYADSRAWVGIPNALNVLVNVPLFWLAVWGWCATRAADWPRSMRVPWQWFHFSAMVSALTSAAYHAVPSDAFFVVSHVGQASGFMLLALGVLAARVDRRFGSTAVCVSVVATIALAGAGMLSGAPPAAIDLRPLMLLEAIPVLLIVASASGWAGPLARPSNGIVVLGFYALAKLFEAADSAIFSASGWISGHSLMHLTLAAAVGWMAYCATVAGLRSADTGSTPDPSQRPSSLNTTGSNAM